jgi:hypothetical protein
MNFCLWFYFRLLDDHQHKFIVTSLMVSCLPRLNVSNRGLLVNFSIIVYLKKVKN